ncbi:hypothetical protein N7486_008974 [Penicillium sp. IBT 16267x]|nr:hypothetical protein N7486_008974 [Penicillium sp. IBT 16267x]
MPRKAQVLKKKNDAQWHRLKIGGNGDEDDRDVVIKILIGINNDLSVDGLNLRLKEDREDVNNALHEEIDKMPAGIQRLHRPSAVKNLYEIFRDQRATWPVAKREELLLDGKDEGEDEDEGEDAEGEEEEGEEVVEKEKEEREDAEESASEEEEEEKKTEQEEKQDDTSSEEESDSNTDPFDYQSEYVLYNAPVAIIRANDRWKSWEMKLSTFLERPGLGSQQSQNQKWINVEYVRLPYVKKALKQMKLLDAPNSSLWWSWHEPDAIDLDSPKGQIRLRNDWDLARAIWRSFEGHFEDFRGPRREVDSLPREHDLPAFTLVIRDDGPDFGVPLGNVPELEGLFDEEVDMDAKSDADSEGLFTRIWKEISFSQRTTRKKRPRDDESDGSQSSRKRRQMAAPWEL